MIFLSSSGTQTSVLHYLKIDFRKILSVATLIPTEPWSQRRKRLPCAGWAFLAMGIAVSSVGTADTAMGTADMRKSGRTF